MLTFVVDVVVVVVVVVVSQPCRGRLVGMDVMQIFGSPHSSQASANTQPRIEPKLTHPLTAFLVLIPCAALFPAVSTQPLFSSSRPRPRPRPSTFKQLHPPSHLPEQCNLSHKRSKADRDKLIWASSQALPRLPGFKALIDVPGLNPANLPDAGGSPFH